MLIATYRLCRLVRRVGHYLLNGVLGHETPRNYHKNEFGNIKIEFPVLFSLHANKIAGAAIKFCLSEN